MPFCELDNLQMHYRIVGEGPPLVLLMVLSGDLTWWGSLVQELENPDWSTCRMQATSSSARIRTRRQGY